jgi:hypothetical protein
VRETRSPRADFFSNAKRIRIPHDDVPAGTAMLPSSRYSAAMSKILDEAMDAVRALPATEQADIEHEMRDRALQARGFTRATGGYELRVPSAWMLGRSARYLATDAQADAISEARLTNSDTQWRWLRPLSRWLSCTCCRRHGCLPISLLADRRSRVLLDRAKRAHVPCMCASLPVVGISPPSTGCRWSLAIGINLDEVDPD